MKRILIILLIIVFSLSLVACNQWGTVDNSKENEITENNGDSGQSADYRNEGLPVIADIGKEFPMSGLFLRKLDNYSIEIQVFGEPRAFVLADNIRGYLVEKKISEGDLLEFTYYKNYGNIFVITSLKKADEDDETNLEDERVYESKDPYYRGGIAEAEDEDVPFEDPHQVIALEIFEAQGIYSGQIDNNFIEVEIEGEYQEFMLSDEAKEKFAKMPPKVDTKINLHYYIDKDNILVITNIE